MSITNNNIAFATNSGSPNPTFSISGISVGSEVRVFKTSDSTEVIGIESTTETTWSTTYSYSGSDIEVYIMIVSLEYTIQYIQNQVLGANGLSIVLNQQTDRAFYNL